MNCPFCGGEAWPVAGIHMCIVCASKYIDGRWHKRMHCKGNACSPYGCPGYDAELGESAEPYQQRHSIAYARANRTGSEENWR